jgi:hypothetical protein
MAKRNSHCERFINYAMISSPLDQSHSTRWLFWRDAREFDRISIIAI